MVTTSLISTVVVVYIVQLLSLTVFKVDYVSSLLAFRAPSFMGGHFWQILSYGWIHSVEMPIHILFNMLTVHYLGRELEWKWGATRYLILYVVGLVSAVALWYVCESPQIRQMETLAGASGAVFALFGGLAAVNPRREIRVLVLFIIPLKGQIRWFFWVSVAFELLCWKMGWLSFIAHMAHVGGALVGWGLGRFWRTEVNDF